MIYRGLLILFLFDSGIANADTMPTIRVAADGNGFVFDTSGKAFIPWGFNYDHDAKGRLLEDYWIDEWKLVEQHFSQMKKLGANVVRIHLQFARFMKSATEPNTIALKQYQKLLQLAEKDNLYLDITGLGCYHKADVPAWYDALSESDRCAAQANFWKAVAKAGTNSPAIFCYDLMNEPVSPAGKRKSGDWLGPAFGGKHFVQMIALDQQDRPRPEIAKKWIAQLKQAIRSEDKTHLITVGLVDWSLDRKGLTSGFVPEKVHDDLDFISLHLYPEKGKVKDSIETLKGFQVGKKPIVIEETFPLKCSRAEFVEFLKESRSHAHGWIGFYWGTPPDALKQSKTIADAILLQWLEIFQEYHPNR